MPGSATLASRQVVAQAIAQAAAPVVKDLGHADGPSVAVTISVAGADRTVQALQHRWVAADIAKYQVDLVAADANGAYNQAITSLDVPAAAYNTSATAQPLAAFTGLVANTKYQVKVTAYGTDPTDAAAGPKVMNGQTAATAVFDFTENATTHNIDTVSNQAVNVVLDSFAFSGTGNLNAQVTNGTWLPAGTISGTPAGTP